MIYRVKDNEFDFSLAVYEADGVHYIDDDIPEIIDDSLINIFHQALVDFIEVEFRFQGIIDENKDMVIFRCYRKNGNVWENVIYDELVNILKEVEHLDDHRRIVNCLMYENS